ncbi:OmpA family protein [uncultured Paludibaculum sp.]|uniref:OmpA family protein n=1 Tax=uncultured Paludibaculum sp. TaxID=1765020 RepID=UPI002AAAB7EC|nr:OmpA family protein [uncultured Paludibaculum sp.]
MKQRHIAGTMLALSFVLLAAGCKKKQPVAPPPPPPAVKEQPKVEKGPAAVVSSFTAEPSTIVRGESSTLRWNVSNATEVTIDNGIGTVAGSGSRQVFPSATTSYRMTAKGDGGDAIAVATVTVTTPPPPPPPEPTKTASLSDRIARDVQDVFFDYDKSEVREDGRATLQRNADALKSILNDFPTAVISLEGHCDERGSAEYNIGLGDRRAAGVKEFLTQMGVPADRVKTVSYGKEKPFCTDSNEDCWQKNRRAHFVGVQ